MATTVPFANTHHTQLLARASLAAAMLVFAMTSVSSAQQSFKEYENSGVMTFIVSHEGKVFQKDLGPRTIQLAERMTSFNPDQTWKEVVVPLSPQ